MKPLVVLLCILVLPLSVPAATPQELKAATNTDESKVRPYTLPDALLTQSGEKVQTADAWMQHRRAEILALFREHIYGAPPRDLGELVFTVKEVKAGALGGKATRKHVVISLKNYPAWQGVELMLYLPSAAKRPVPCFVGLSFGGNQAVSPEMDVPLSTRWMNSGLTKGIVNNLATEASRATESSRWPIERIIESGFALATAYCGDIEPDSDVGWRNGIRGISSKEGSNTVWKDGDWGTIAAWAWGLSRMMDYLETDPAINAKQCAVVGHSRLGKTALWAGASDQRFAIVISNDSGEGGAALMRRNFGENVAVLAGMRPYWFTPTYARYTNNENACPVDSHMLIALDAPRPAYIASASEDLWADPKGEFLAAKNAESIYALFGKKGVGVESQPAVDTPVGDTIGYHLRRGKHDLTAYDWEQYLKFATRHFQSDK